MIGRVTARAVRVLGEHDGRATDPSGSDGRRAVLREAEDRDRGRSGLRSSVSGARAARDRRTRRTATSLRGSNATTSAGRRRAATGARRRCPAGPQRREPQSRRDRAARPSRSPRLRRPQAVPSTRTTLGDARRTPAARASRGSGGATGAAGPAMVGNGSTRASTSRTSVGETHLVQPLQKRRGLRTAAKVRLPGQEQRNRAEHPDDRKPAERPENETAGRVEGGELRPAHRASEAPTRERAERLEQDRPDRRARPEPRAVCTASACRPEGAAGASREPSQAPRTIPASESAVEMSPFFQPMKAVKATKPSAIRSTLVIRSGGYSRLGSLRDAR